MVWALVIKLNFIKISHFINEFEDNRIEEIENSRI
jgi:hypothetical protein